MISVNAETTATRDELTLRKPALAGSVSAPHAHDHALDKQTPANWVLYDASCSRCTALAQFFRPVLRRRGFLTAPLQSLWVPSALCMGPRELLQGMRVFTAHGELHSGADGVIYLARRIVWAWPLWALAQLPGAMSALRTIYRWVAAHRHCQANTCTIPERRLR